jgi:hypothetical protein
VKGGQAVTLENLPVTWKMLVFCPRLVKMMTILGTGGGHNRSKKRPKQRKFLWVWHLLPEEECLRGRCELGLGRRGWTSLLSCFLLLFMRRGHGGRVGDEKLVEESCENNDC